MSYQGKTRQTHYNFLTSILIKLSVFLFFVSFFLITPVKVHASNLFFDGFESGDLNAWSGSTTDGGDLSVQAAAALHGTYGLNIYIHDDHSKYVYDTTPNAEKRYRFRLYIDPNTLTMANNDQFALFWGFQEDWSNYNVAIYLEKKSSNYYIAYLDRADNAWSIFNEIIISDNRHCIEVDWKASSAPGANNGFLKLWVDVANPTDDNITISHTSIDNDTENIGSGQIGAMDKDAGTSGTFYLDDFASNNDGTEIGAYPSPLSVPSSLAQYKSDGTTTIASADWTNESTVTLKFSMSSDNASDLITPQVEVRETGTAFSNAVTNSGDAVAYSGSPVTGTVTVTGLTSHKTYHWQARASNSEGESSWVAMGGNPDFGVDTTAPTGGSIIYTGGNYTVASVALTVSDGADIGSGINTSSRIIQRKSATLLNGSCGDYGSFATITPTGTYPNFTDTTVTSGNCYQYQYLVSDNYTNQATYNPLDLGMMISEFEDATSFDRDIDILMANGFTEFRIQITSYQYTTFLAESKAAVIRTVAKGANVIWGISSNPFDSAGWVITAASWPTFRQEILDAATWAQANGVYEFAIGNEEEWHVDGTTMTVAQIMANIKAVATDVQAIFTRGNVSYTCLSTYISDWVTLGRGDIDILASNVYMGGTTFNDAYQTNITNLINGFGAAHTNITEFAPSYTSLASYSTDEYIQAQAITTMINYIKASGMTRATFFMWSMPWNTFANGVVKSDLSYRKLWNTLKSNVNVVKVDTSAPIGGSITYTDGYYTSLSVGLTANDGTDSVSGINISTRIVQRKSATLSNGTCGDYGSFETITPTGTYQNFTDSTVVSGNCYQYQYLVSDNATKQATYTSTNTVKVDTSLPSTPGTPSTTSPTNSSSQTWSWIAATDTVSGIASYAWRVVDQLNNAIVDGTTTGLSAVTNLAEGVWNFFVKAIDNATNQGSESTSSVTVDKTAPVTTDNIVDSSWHNTDVTVVLTCNDTGGGSCATTYYTTDGVDPTTSSSTGNSFTLTTDGTYTIKYFSKDTADNSETVKTATNTVEIDKTAPSVPGTPSATSPTNNTKPTWTWDISTDSGSDLATPAYTIQWSTDSSFISDVNASTSTTNSFTHSTALADDTWYFRVKATDTAGNPSAFSANGSVIVDTLIFSLTSLSTIPTSSGTTITWDTSKDTSSKVDYGLTSSYGSSTAETDTIPRVSTHTVTVPNLVSCTYYHYRVRSTDAATNEVISGDNTFISYGCPPNSNSSSSQTATNTAPSCGDARPSSTPDLFQINTNSTTAKLFFTPISNTNKYYVSYSTKPLAEEYGVEVTLAREGVQNFTINLLKPNTIYYFKIRGQNGCMPGDWSNIFKVVTRTQGVIKTVPFYKNLLVKINSLLTSVKKLMKVNSSPVTTTPSQVSIISPQPTPSPAPKIITEPTTLPVVTPTPKKFCFLWWCF